MPMPVCSWAIGHRYCSGLRPVNCKNYFIWTIFPDAVPPSKRWPGKNGPGNQETPQKGGKLCQRKRLFICMFSLRTLSPRGQGPGVSRLTPRHGVSQQWPSATLLDPGAQNRADPWSRWTGFLGHFCGKDFKTLRIPLLARTVGSQVRLRAGH